MRNTICLFLVLLILAGCGGNRELMVVKPGRGKIRETFNEPARTRLEKTWRIAMPVSGRIERIDLEPGDPVKKGQKLVEFDLVPIQQALEEARAAVSQFESQIRINEYDKLEQTALEESHAAIKAAREALQAADAEVEAEKARSERAEKELLRKIELHRNDAISKSELEDYELAAETALIDLRKQQFMRAAMNAVFTIYQLGPKAINEWLGRKTLEKEVITHQLTQARSRLAAAQHNLKLANVVSPIDGVVLERYEQGDGFFAAGTPLLLIGNLEDLEVEADILSQDALRISPGSTVFLESPAIEGHLPGKVKRIDPAGFTKLSSLGVEQQRVRVIIALEKGHEGLGVGYRLQAAFLTGFRENALIVPRFSVLQDPDGAYYVFRVKGGRLEKREVKIGLRGDLDLEILDGLTESDLIAATPDTTLKEGQKVKPVENNK